MQSWRREQTYSNNSNFKCDENTPDAVQYPALTTIATIPVAPSATNGGSVAKFAVDTLGITYSRIG
jgi:hypothetical protein